MVFKLIRDNIPEIMQQNGEMPSYATAQTDSLFIDLLRMKLVECVEDFLATNDAATLVDLQLAIDSIIELAGVGKEEFIKRTEEKLAAEGGYTKRNILFYNPPVAQEGANGGTK